MKFLLSTLIVSCLNFGNSAKACICTGGDYSLNSLQQLEQYDFIALVKVNNLRTVINDTIYHSVGLWDIDIIEKFKGEDYCSIYDLELRSSCNIGLSKGSEWILFGRMIKGRLSITACDRNKSYRNASGQRNWKYCSGFYTYKRLQELYHHQIKMYGTEKRVEFYPDGTKEIEEEYVNGKRNGERKIYFPNGQLMCQQSFVNDTLDGKSVWYFKTGQTEEIDFYKRGKSSDTSRQYYDTSSSSKMFHFALRKNSVIAPLNKIQLQIESIYNENGDAVRSRYYAPNGYLERETTLNQQTNVTTNIGYHENGKISSIGYYVLATGKYLGHYQEYDTHGTPTHGWDYDENGKVVKPMKQ